MNMEAIFVLTYVGVIVVTTALAGLGYLIHTRSGWKQVKRWAALAGRTAAQVALLWFCGMGVAFSLAMLYRIFARPAELTVLAAVVSYITGMAAAIGLWFAAWRGMEAGKEDADGKALGK
ncbi:MAG: hypothetical protein J6C98_07815 [Oscillospiraceae bacterium]|nr:hypothetical protein [Oscillospiraceae bacterium]